MSRPVLLAVSASEWDGPQARPHHFMRLAAQSGWDVLYLEPPASLLAPLKSLESFHRMRRWRSGLRRVAEHLFVLAPPPVLPGGNRLRSLNRANQALIAAAINRVIDQLDPEHLDIYSYLPAAIDLLPHLRRRKRLIYDCVDDHAAFGGWMDPQLVERMEYELAGQADVCIATARRLVQRGRQWAHPPEFVPNGCEVKHFEQARLPGNLPTPTDLLDILARGNPLAGFFGAIGSWVDLPLLAEVAARRPQVEFVLIGPLRGRPRISERLALSRLPNVHLLGARPYVQLPAYLQHVAVCLLPFRAQRLTESVNPIKVYEYLAAGKPVVSTPLPEVRYFGETVMSASGAADYCTAIDTALLEDQGAEAPRRQALARECSWERRWGHALSLIRSAGVPL